jgi:hypothetical protein
MKSFIMVMGVVFFAIGAQAKNYYVQPLICKGKWNKQPPEYHPSYEQAGIKVISFWSVRASDCSLAPSSSTASEYAPITEELKVDDSLEIGGWYGEPLKADGNKVSAPAGVWANPLELTITSTRTEGGVRKDQLVARDHLFDDYHYDLVCEATVVENPAHIENNTRNCPTPRR